MKTITEYRPMIFTQLTIRSEVCARRRRRLRRELLFVATYGVLGMGLCFDTGFAPWHWQFWLMFAPLFAAGELASRQLLVEKQPALYDGMHE
jgi:hypothetical protein